MRILAWLALVMGIAGCGAARLERHEFARVCMGVRASVVLYAPDRETAESAAAAAFTRIAALDAVMSDYRPTSELMRLCDRAGKGPVEVSADLFEVLAGARRVSEASDGALDVTVGPAVALWRRARREGALPGEEELAAARRLIDWRMVVLDGDRRTACLVRPGMRLDLGAIGKGFAAQRAVDLLRARGCTRCLVSLAGDVVAGDPPPGEAGWRVQVCSVPSPQLLMLANAAVSTSGDTEQFVEIGGKRYSHIVDPATGLGAEAHRSVTVVSPRGEWADALSTAAYLLGRERSGQVLGRFEPTRIVNWAEE